MEIPAYTDSILSLLFMCVFRVGKGLAIVICKLRDWISPLSHGLRFASISALGGIGAKQCFAGVRRPQGRQQS